MSDLINNLGGKYGFGENSLDRNDDGYSSAIDISSIFPNGINLFDNTYTYMYVNTNGNITFTGGLSSFTPGQISAGTSPIIAAFWADVDTRSGEVNASNNDVNVDYSLNAYKTYLNNDDLYYSNITTTSLLSNYDISNYDLTSFDAFIVSAESLSGISKNELYDENLEYYYSFLSDSQDKIIEQMGDSNYNADGNSRGTNLVWYDLDEESETITVTWDDVGYYNNKVDKTNAFQLQLKNTGDGSFDIDFIYEDINWVTGDASDGYHGLGGTVARAGYSAGDGVHYYELPFSGNQESMLSLDEVGVWSLSSSASGEINGIGLEDTDDTLNGTNFSDIMDGRSGDDVLNGGLGDDNISGGDGNDVLNGGEGNDTLFSGSGEDIIDGGDGDDTVSYVEHFNNYNFNDLDNQFIVISDSGDSKDTIENVESIAFSDVTLNLDEVEELLNLEESVSRLYTALLGRTPDNDGLLYWLNDLNQNDTSIQDISGAFAGSEEYEARFGAQSDEEFINQLYNNILGRDADNDGYSYWLDEISQTGDRTGMIVSFSNSEEYKEAQIELIGAYLDSVNLNTYLAWFFKIKILKPLNKG